MLKRFLEKFSHKCKRTPLISNGRGELKQIAGLFRAPLLWRAHNDSHGKISPNPLPVKHLFSYSPINYSQKSTLPNPLPQGEREGARKRVAFTLAEVLITLGIIGVVAAITLPTLIQNHRKHEVETKLKKIYSVMNQAINMSVAENGEPKEWYVDCGPSSASTCTAESTQEWFNQYIGKYLKITKSEIGPIPNNIGSTTQGCWIYFSDGSILYVADYIYDMRFYMNEKARQNPIHGRNTFWFRFNPVLGTGQGTEKNKYTIKDTFEPYAWSWDGTREGLIDGSKNRYACGGNGGFCAKLIQYEGWKIPKDYPIKF